MVADSSERASTSASTSAPLPMPTSPTRTASRAQEHRSGNWREENALMQHQLRQAKAEIAQLSVSRSRRRTDPLLPEQAGPRRTRRAGADPGTLVGAPNSACRTMRPRSGQLRLDKASVLRLPNRSARLLVDGPRARSTRSATAHHGPSMGKLSCPLLPGGLPLRRSSQTVTVRSSAFPVRSR